MAKAEQDRLITFLASLSGSANLSSFVAVFGAGLYFSRYLPPTFHLDSFIDKLIADAGIFGGFVMFGTPIVLFAMLMGAGTVVLLLADFVELAMLYALAGLYLKKRYTAEDILEAYAQLSQISLSQSPNQAVAATLKKLRWYGKLIDWETRLIHEVVHAAYRPS